MLIPVNKEELVLGVVADTHVPDRLPDLNPNLIPGLRSYSVDMILHAGDICSPRVLTQLMDVAPVVAVLGNRDLLFWGRLRTRELLEWEGYRISLVHGHGGLLGYLADKYYFYTQGYRFERYAKKMIKGNPDANIVIYGHTHYPVVDWYRDVLMFNPGSACLGVRGILPPSFGILRLTAGDVQGEIVEIPF